MKPGLWEILKNGQSAIYRRFPLLSTQQNFYFVEFDVSPPSPPSFCGLFEIY